MAGNAEDFRNQGPGEATAAVLRMHQYADAANVPFPAAELLMERGVADDLVIHQRKQRQVAAEVNVLAPIADDRQFGHAMLDELRSGLGHREEELVKGLFVVLAQRSKLALRPVLELDFLRIFLEFEFE